MVIHDKEREQQWVEKRHKQTEKKELPSVKTSCRLSIVAIQSLACIALILVVLLLRIAGGSAYIGLQQRFSEALASNELMAVWMKWCDEEAGAMIEGAKLEGFTQDESLE